MFSVQVIEENQETAKAWFRRGEANFALNDWEAARADFKNTVDLDPENKAAKNKVQGDQIYMAVSFW